MGHRGGHTVRRSKGRRHHGIRKPKTRRTTRRIRRITRRQRGGAYTTDALKNLLSNSENYNASVDAYRGMNNAGINFGYPQYAYTTRFGQNAEEIRTHHFIILISTDPPGTPPEMEDNITRDLIYIHITAEDDTYLSAPITLLPASKPAEILQNIQEELGTETVKLTSVVGSVADPTPLRPAYYSILYALSDIYRRPTPNGGNVGVSEL